MLRKQFDISLALGLNEHYDHRVAVGIIKFARARADWRLFGSDWLLHSDKERRDFRPDGIIARIADRETLHRLRRSKVPVVDIAGASDDAALPRAVNDDFLTGRMAGLHFLERGFRNFAHVGVDGAAWSRKRADGLLHALREAHGGAAGFAEHAVGLGWLRREYSLAGLAKWLRRLPRPCAVLAANDRIGYRVSMAAALAGLASPADIAVMGVDNEEVYCELSRPPLSSVVCDCERIGWEAANLLAQILGNEDPLRQVVVPPVGITARESTDIMLDGDPLVRDIKHFIRANAEKGINVGDVAAAFPLSRRALEKRFKSAESRTIHDEIQTVRLERSRSLLADGESAAAAAYKSGFSTVQHFYHAFRKKYGGTPMAFAASHSRNKYSYIMNCGGRKHEV